MKRSIPYVLGPAPCCTLYKVSQASSASDYSGDARIRWPLRHGKQDIRILRSDVGSLLANGCPRNCHPEPVETLRRMQGYRKARLAAGSLRRASAPATRVKKVWLCKKLAQLQARNVKFATASADRFWTIGRIALVSQVCCGDGFQD